MAHERAAQYLGTTLEQHIGEQIQLAVFRQGNTATGKG